MNREELQERVFQELLIDFEYEDYTVLFELLGFIDEKYLKGALREELPELDLSDFDGQELLNMRFTVLQDILGQDTCWNQPKPKLLKKGTTVIFTGASNNGDIFVKNVHDERDDYIVSGTDACKTRFPYDRGLINLEYFRRLKWSIW